MTKVDKSKNPKGVKKVKVTISIPAVWKESLKSMVGEAYLQEGKEVSISYFIRKALLSEYKEKLDLSITKVEQTGTLGELGGTPIVKKLGNDNSSINLYDPEDRF